MNNLKEETWEAEMLAAVDANHRRAVREYCASNGPVRKEYPIWSCILLIVIMAAIAAACVAFAFV